jgi:hypothetical protein
MATTTEEVIPSFLLSAESPLFFTPIKAAKKSVVTGVQTGLSFPLFTGVSSGYDSEEEFSPTSPISPILPVSPPSSQELEDLLVREVPEDQALAESIERAILATSLFLDIDRSSQGSSASEIQEEILDDYSVFSLSGRSLRSSLVAFTQPDVRESPVARFTTIKIHLGADVTSDCVTVNTMWSKCIGNQYVYHVGPYGKTKRRTSVLQVLKDVLQGSDEKETQKILFTKLTDCVKKGQAISTEELLAINSKLGGLSAEEFSLIRAELLALTYLIYHLEVTRRPKYEDSVGHKHGAAAKEKTILCCEIIFDTWTKVLELLKIGALTIEDVFAADAPYGLPTGKKLRDEDDDSGLEEKYARIDDLYMKTFFPVRYAAAHAKKQSLIPSMEEAHRRLSRNSSFVQESPGGLYFTPEARRARAKKIPSLKSFDKRGVLDFSDASLASSPFSDSVVDSPVVESSQDKENVAALSNVASPTAAILSPVSSFLASSPPLKTTLLFSASVATSVAPVMEKIPIKRKMIAAKRRHSRSERDDAGSEELLAPMEVPKQVEALESPPSAKRSKPAPVSEEETPKPLFRRRTSPRLSSRYKTN